MTMEQKERVPFLDVLQILACFCVICLHCSGQVFLYGEASMGVWIPSLAIQTLAHWAVPVFFMITGATLLDYRDKYDTPTFCKKRLLRTGLPFVFWSLFYLGFHALLQGGPLPGLGDVWGALFNNGANNIFWFFYALFALYLCMPIFSRLAKPAYRRTVTYLCLLSFLVTAVYPLVSRVLPLYWELPPSYLGGYVGYLFGGWLLRHETFSEKVRRLIYGGGLAGAFLLFFGTWYLSARQGSLDTLLMDYGSLACYPMAFAVMLAVKHRDWSFLERLFPEAKRRRVAQAGLGVYVLHMAVLELFERLPGYQAHPLLTTLLLPLPLYLISLGITLLLQRIPGLCRLVP